MKIIRQPAVAGMFYPADPQQLRTTVLDLLATAQDNLPMPKAIIAPHAGYIYSGPIAANAFACLTKATATIKQVVLIGPAHRYPVSGIAAPQADIFATPLGQIEVDHDTLRKIASQTQLEFSDDAHNAEHCLEVQLPFLQLLLKNFKIVPLLTGMTDINNVTRILNTLWNGKSTLIIISSDLSHYHNYQTAQKMDQQAAKAIINLSPNDLGKDQACGCLSIRGLLQVAQIKKLTAKLIDLRNSGDTAGPKDQVVGYGAFHFYDGENNESIQ